MFQDEEYDIVNSSQLNSESEAEDGGDSSGSDKKTSKKQQQRPSIPGERKSSRSRKGAPPSMVWQKLAPLFMATKKC